MNKRIKKKWSRVARLETKVSQLMAENALLTDAVKRHTRLIEELHQVSSHNTEATNNRFDALESANKSMKLELHKATLEFGKAKKKYWFGLK
ncbi:hypothetical protein [Streptococcus sp. E17BB]|uniref:hypothetical protein n=1 Tax=Streptococcus sp. E17BB TaxID=3278714 RepID=UPI00359EE674